MTTFLAAVFLLILGCFGLGAFLALGSLYLMALTISLAALSFLPAPHAWYVVGACAVVQFAWMAFCAAAKRRYHRRLDEANKHQLANLNISQESA